MYTFVFAFFSQFFKDKTSGIMIIAVFSACEKFRVITGERWQPLSVLLFLLSISSYSEVMYIVYFNTLTKHKLISE